MCRFKTLATLVLLAAVSVGLLASCRGEDDHVPAPTPSSPEERYLTEVRAIQEKVRVAAGDQPEIGRSTIGGYFKGDAVRRYIRWKLEVYGGIAQALAIRF